MAVEDLPMLRGGAAGNVACRLSTWTDHVLDVFESRAVRPVPVTVEVPTA